MLAKKNIKRLNKVKGNIVNKQLFLKFINVCYFRYNKPNTQ